MYTSEASYLQRHHETLESILSQVMCDMVATQPLEPLTFIVAELLKHTAASAAPPISAAPFTFPSTTVSTVLPAPPYNTIPATPSAALPSTANESTSGDRLRNRQTPPLLGGEWSVAAWVASLRLHEQVAHALLAPLEPGATTTQQVAYVRSLSDDSGREAILQLLHASSLLDGVVGEIHTAAKVLAAAEAATSKELVAKFCQDSRTFSMCFSMRSNPQARSFVHAQAHTSNAPDVAGRSLVCQPSSLASRAFSARLTRGFPTRSSVSIVAQLTQRKSSPRLTTLLQRPRRSSTSSSQTQSAGSSSSAGVPGRRRLG